MIEVPELLLAFNAVWLAFLSLAIANRRKWWKEWKERRRTEDAKLDAIVKQYCETHRQSNPQ